jgi:hypothetical protein
MSNGRQLGNQKLYLTTAVMCSDHRVTPFSFRLLVGESDSGGGRHVVMAELVTVAPYVKVRVEGCRSRRCSIRALHLLLPAIGSFSGFYRSFTKIPWYFTKSSIRAIYSGRTRATHTHTPEPDTDMLSGALHPPNKIDVMIHTHLFTTHQYNV